jgi:hypothetical protein
MVSKESRTISELVNTISEEMTRLDYKPTVLKQYHIVWNKLCKLAGARPANDFDMEFGMEFLDEAMRSHPKHLNENSKHRWIKAIYTLADFKRTGILSLRREKRGFVFSEVAKSASAAKWDVEGFSEVLSREVAPLGIKVTIVEPGGFRTDFAGSSTELSEGHLAYDSTVGDTARFQRNYNGKQPGDPKKAAQAIIQLTQERNPPLRLLLGSDAYAAVEKNDLARLEEARIWKELSISTDFETE